MIVFILLIVVAAAVVAGMAEAGRVMMEELEEDLDIFTLHQLLLIILLAVN